MMRELIPKRRASMSKATGDKINVDTRLGEEIEGGKDPRSVQLDKLESGFHPSGVDTMRSNQYVAG